MLEIKNNEFYMDSSLLKFIQEQYITFVCFLSIGKTDCSS